MMVIRLERNRKIIKPRELDNVEDTLEKAILETLNADYDLIRRLGRERGTAEVEA